MRIKITSIKTFDICFPTSRALNGSDAMSVDPDYSAAYVIVRTDSPAGLAGHGSAAVFGTTDEDRPMTERDEPQPTSHYGVFKRCNEGNARVYFLDHGVSSIGLRPLTVYGAGRDPGLTSDPTKAMKAAVIGRPFHIRFGGRTDFQYVADTADVFIHTATSELSGAHVFNLHGETIDVRDVIAEIEGLRPEVSGSITCAAKPLAIPAEMDDAAIRKALGPQPATPLAVGVRATVERFAELQREGCLDTSDLDA